MFFLRQIKEVKLTNEVFSYLSDFYSRITSHVHSFNNQLITVNKRLSSTNCSNDIANSIILINNLNNKNSGGIVDSIKFLIDFYSNNRQFYIILNQLSLLLNYEYYD